MKTLKFAIFSHQALCVVGLALMTMFTGCRKDDDKPAPVYPVENMLSEYISGASLTVSSPRIDMGDYEFGLVFSPKVKGKITAINAQIPDVNANMRVTIWDFDAQTVIRTEYINVSSASTVIHKSISPLELQMDKEYMITMNYNDWYMREKSSGTISYPIHAGNIVIHNYGYASGTLQVFPQYWPQDYYAGDLSFDFQQIP